ncbi:O-antigen ligase family protein [Ramlibacter rhizophilus]|uniref:Polymerase n=1 Tax=Ramlibacter rhizophilus TaxID=1781167 RepID=A0A4Z0BPM4_9BURK|nr:O-antigen ligase family protein [Ramlibacter rhizophilus]TFZ00005.1 polymerase [Ramlibacter rhizophilus]
MKATTRRSAGLLPWAFPAMLFLTAVDLVLVNRDLTQQFLHLQSVAETARHPITTVLQRAVSLFLLVASVEQIANHFALKRPLPSFTLLMAFVLYWIGTVGATALFAANPYLSHEYMYSLGLGVACCLVGVADREKLLRRARDALFLLMLAGVLLIPIKTTMVLDIYYTQGLIPGLPRFGGLTAHPVTQGMLAQVALLLLWVMPYERRSINRLAWLLGLGVLFIAQSKTAWIGWAACALVLGAVRYGGEFLRRLGNPRDNSFGIVVCLALIVGVAGLAGWVLIGDAFGAARDFANSRGAVELMTLTGRDRIWIAAIEEWQLNPTFGYGLTIWDSVYRAAIGMPNATHAHNQFLDDLARSGSVGATTLVIYATVLLILAIRGARASGGLSLALFTAVAVRSISEVPLSLMGYGTELFTHLLLVATLAAASAQRQLEPRRAPLRYGVVS